MDAPRFIYTNDHEGPVRVGVARDDEDRYGEPLCVLNHRTEEGGGEKWWFYETHPTEYGHIVARPGISFPSKEVAAFFYWALCERVKAVNDALPLPQEVRDYLTERARYLHEEEQQLRLRFIQIRREQYDLLQFAKDHRIPSVAYLTEESDAVAVVKKLLGFEIIVPSDDEKSPESVPFISEAALYPLIGKDDARTFLALLDTVVKFVAPNL